MELYESILKQLKEQAENTELGTSLDDSTFDTEEFQLAALKAAARKLEQRIKEKKKPKTITISGEVHNSIKTHCAMMGLNIGKWTEQVLMREISENNCIEMVQSNYDEYINETVEDIKTKYTTKKTMYKADKLIMCEALRLVGESVVDGMPVYELVDQEINPLVAAKFIANMGIIVEITDENTIPLSIDKYDTDAVIINKKSLY
jgi:hypothetical protein